MTSALRLARAACITTAVLLGIFGVLSLLAALLTFLGVRQAMGEPWFMGMAGVLLVLVSMAGFYSFFKRSGRGRLLGVLYGILLLIAAAGIPFVLGLDLILTGFLFFLSASGLWIIVVYQKNRFSEETV